MSALRDSRQTLAAEATLAAQRDNITQLSEISRNSGATFLALIAACFYSYLTIATTTDAGLLSNSSATPLPIIQVNVPIVWFFYAAPLILTVLFLYFHLYLEQFWRCVKRLPLRHPDGRGLDEYVYPWLISSALIRGEIRQLSTSNRLSARIEAWLSLLLAWWLVPTVLVFYWARYLVAHDWKGTSLHIVLVILSTGTALHFFRSVKTALRTIAEQSDEPTRSRVFTVRWIPGRYQIAVASIMVFGVMLLYLSICSIEGLPQAVCERVELETRCNGFYKLGAGLWKQIGIKPHADIRGHRFVSKPGNWRELLSNENGLRNFVETQSTVTLIGRDLRGIDGEEAFWPGARIHMSSMEYANLRHSILTGSHLENVNMRGSDLTDIDLQQATIINAKLDQVISPAARFVRANFADATSSERSSLSGDFSGAVFDSARGDYLLFGGGNDSSQRTSLRETSLAGATFKYANFERVDLSGARIFNEANLSRSTFVEVDFSGATIHQARFIGAVFNKCRFVGTKIDDSVFDEATFHETVFDQDTNNGKVEDRLALKSVTGFHAFGAIFEAKTKVRNIKFDGGDLRSVQFKDVEFHNTEFSDTDLSGATFQNVDMSGVEFENVDLTGANLVEAQNVRASLLEKSCGNADTRLPSGLTIQQCVKGKK